MSEKHLSTQFDAELTSISSQVLEMGGIVESQVIQAVQALIDMDSELAQQVHVREELVNQLEMTIDSDLSATIAQRQPTARDLRLLVAVSKTIGNLERAGDEAARIARFGLRLSSRSDAAMLQQMLPLRDLTLSARMAAESLRKALDAFARLDTALAIDVLRQDDNIDHEFNAMLRKLVTVMSAKPDLVEAGIDLIFVAKALERVGDHAKNLAEQVIYVVKGADVRHNRLETIEKRLAAG
ncbi:phosphate signaling complex protein PhoU [Amphibiibacter pelophylacis]|uniref:Phosphate signaling complex protein PhoU n=1 Tax=Amphibiibacter pelophylacis TaxID=1799477 RepID=A0ACC6P1K0_9BURK